MMYITVNLAEEFMRTPYKIRVAGNFWKMESKMKHLAVRSENRYEIYNAAGAVVGHTYYLHGREDRKDLDDIMKDSFKIKKEKK